MFHTLYLSPIAVRLMPKALCIPAQHNVLGIIKWASQITRRFILSQHVVLGWDMEGFQPDGAGLSPNDSGSCICNAA
jgi:hypothetical protein